MFSNSIARAKLLGKELGAVASHYDCHFIDAAPHIKLSGIDGIHLDLNAHNDLAKLLHSKLYEIYGNLSDDSLY